ncbi:hypothetical protein OS493_037873 [Desmophyllum pertusum]|uniref:Uncharacterized protein n=1 Tax=Desmophyllum pertusum TaxID=174260 RepID=A0A9X0CNH3_9CNID|nr:hypothetical protein OS493_037873 [Desmophyllum pertusum]
MEGIQPEILVVLLYLSLIYEIIIGIKRRGQQSFEKMRKVSVRFGKTSRGSDRMAAYAFNLALVMPLVKAGFHDSITGEQIGHTQVRLTADHKWIPSGGSKSRNRLEQNELVAIPLVNEGIDVVFTSILGAVVGKGEECVTIDVNRLHIECAMRLKSLQFKCPPDHLNTAD